MKISIIGAGYVGLTTGACFASLGHKVLCVDNDAEKIEILRSQKCPIFEPGLEELIKKGVSSGSLLFTQNIQEAVIHSEIIFICVNTPMRDDGRADLRFIEKAACDIAKYLQEYAVIVDKSTVPIKTAEKVKETIMRHKKTMSEFDVVSNPEFLREGNAVYDILHPARIVIGVESRRAEDTMLELYKEIIEKTQVAVKITSIKSAELIKHGANTLLCAKISFANLIAEVCEETGADAQEVLEAIGLDPRIGKEFLRPGIGFGGSCFPKDISAFKKTLEVLRIDHAFIDAIEKINNWAQIRFIKKIEKELWVLDGKHICILGLAFKPNTDDIRNSPALKILKALKDDGAIIHAHDPQAQEKVKKLFPDIQYFSDPYSAAFDCDALCVCTDWEEYKNLDYAKLKDIMKTPLLFDGRGALDPKKAKNHGCMYIGIGR